MANLETLAATTRYFAEVAAPSTPSAGQAVVYVKSDGKIYLKDDAGTETDLTAGGGGAVATDAIWDTAGDLAVGTGANTAAKLVKGAAGGALSIINAAVAWNSGTSFPGSVVTGDRYWRTDLRMEYFYDGTRWLTTNLYRLTFARAQISATGELAYAPSFGGVDAWLENAHFSTAVLTTNDTTNKWTVEIYKGVTAGGADASIVSMTTNGDTAGNKVLETVAIGALAGTNAAWYYTFGTKVAAPGDLRCTASITYRLVGT